MTKQIDNKKNPKLIKKETPVGPVYVDNPASPAYGEFIKRGVDYANSHKEVLEQNVMRRINMERKKLTLGARFFPSFDEAYKYDMDPVSLFGRWIGSIGLAVTLTYGGCQGIGNNIEYSEGVRAGMINKFSNKGLFWKTYEGQMALEGIVSGKNSVGANVWNFSLDRQARNGENTEELAEKIRQSLETGTKVRVTYVEPLATWPWRSGTDYLIQNVEPVEQK